MKQRVAMDDAEIITVSHADEITVEHDPFDRESDDVVVRIMSLSGLEPARWLRFDMATGRERARKINELIYALQRVRDQ